MARIIGKTEDQKDIYGLDFEIEVKECKQTEDGKRIVSMVGSTPSVDRDGDTIRQKGWDTKAYKTNPVILWGHNHSIPAIGRANKFSKTAEALVFDEIEFPPEGIHKFADMVYSLMEAKFIKAGSVGFLPTDMESREREEGEPKIGWCPTDFKKQELLEFSIVNVGSNRDALVNHLGAKGFKPTGKVKIGEQEFDVKQLIEAIFAEDKEDKTVIRFRHYPLADEDTKWSGPKEIREADVAQLKKMSTWFDSEDPDVKSSYKLPHHQASDLKTVWNGVRAAMGALLGARGGVDVPEGDRKGIFNHLKSHYVEFDKEVPEFKAYEEAELKELFPALFEEKEVEEQEEGTACVVARYHVVVNEQDTLVDIPLKAVDAVTWEHDYSLAPESWDSMEIITTTEKEFDPGISISMLADKAGAVLSRANKTKLNNAVKDINSVLAAAEPAASDEGNSDNGKTPPPELVSVKELTEQVAKLTALVMETIQELKKPPEELKPDLEEDKDLDNEINLEEIELSKKDGDIDLEDIKLSDNDSQDANDGDILKDIDSKLLIEEIGKTIKSTLPQTVKNELNRALGKVE